MFLDMTRNEKFLATVSVVTSPLWLVDVDTANILSYGFTFRILYSNQIRKG